MCNLVLTDKIAICTDKANSYCTDRSTPTVTRLQHVTSQTSDSACLIVEIKLPQTPGVTHWSDKTRRNVCCRLSAQCELDLYMINIWHLTVKAAWNNMLIKCFFNIMFNRMYKNYKLASDIDYTAYLFKSALCYFRIAICICKHYYGL